MDSNTHQSYLLKQQNQPISGLLRFRSAPTSLLSNKDSNSSSSSNHFWECSDNINSGSSSFQEFEENNNNNKTCSKELSEMNSSGYGGGLPPHYPRHGSGVTSSSAMNGSFGLGMEHETTHKSFPSNLLRQGSSPASLFSNISFQNGILLFLLFLFFIFLILFTMEISIVYIVHILLEVRIDYATSLSLCSFLCFYFSLVIFF